MSGETITIFKDQYEELVDDKRFLDALIIAGVHKWEGYDDARRIYNELSGDKDE